jgi:hypothetical protein
MAATVEAVFSFANYVFVLGVYQKAYKQTALFHFKGIPAVVG